MQLFDKIRRLAIFYFISRQPIRNMKIIQTNFADGHDFVLFVIVNQLLIFYLVKFFLAAFKFYFFLINFRLRQMNRVKPDGGINAYVMVRGDLNSPF